MADRFQMLLSTLVLKVATEHEATKVHLVRTLRGYVTFLGASLTPYLDASIESIYSALCRVVSFAALDIELVVHQTLPSAETPEEEGGGANANVMVSQFQKRLRFFNEEASVREVLLLLHDVGSVSTPAGFIDCAFTLLADANSMTGESGGAETVLVLNEFLRAYCPQTDHEALDAQENGSVDVHLVGRVLEDLLALDAWEERSSSSSSSNKKALVSQRALMVECVGVCAEILGTDFKLFLLQVLYPLVEQLGSRNVEVERAALAALEKVYILTNYESLEGLFQANMDYFVDSLCARLEHLDVYPMTAFVVEALLRHTRLASLPLVDEVASSLLQSVDLYQDSPHVDGLLRALKYLLRSIARDAEEADVEVSATVSRNSDGLNKMPPPHSLLVDFIDEMKMLASDGADALEVETEDDDAAKHEVAENGAPPTVKGAMPLEYDEIQSDDDQEEGPNKEDGNSGYRALVIDVLDRCGYFLAESDPIACCLVFSLIDEGVRFLARHKKQLLPLVARMWPELLPRLRMDNRAIVTAAVHVIATLAEIAGDFVGDRFVETVWPILRTQLQAIDVDANAKSSQLTRSMLLISKQTTETADILATQTSEPDEKTQSHGENEPSAVNGTRKSQEIRQLLAILSCLTMPRLLIGCHLHHQVCASLGMNLTPFGVSIKATWLA
ncbi:hypothetical protein BBP00_00002266 [Phytophthora kernoviae]|uniref:TTI1 C-terminal TPR domain-containing protein n=1 Tax=Phytophthora kernoviae TaxID=325452 RepID=A0A3F2RY23_9STRA|nr:hypothetical protein BBP00_00002266 [Phytophthora kernoviae]